MKQMQTLLDQLAHGIVGLGDRDPLRVAVVVTDLERLAGAGLGAAAGSSAVLARRFSRAHRMLLAGEPSDRLLEQLDRLITVLGSGHAPPVTLPDVAVPDPVLAACDRPA